MKEKEFKNLKAGDKVWYVCNWLDKECDDEQANELEVVGKDKRYGFVKTNMGEFCLSGVYLTKAEAWEAEVEIMENAIKEGKKDLEEKRQRLDRYKTELAKARRK